MPLRSAPRRAALVAASLAALGILLVAACGTPTPTPPCLEAQDGTFVPAACAVEGQPEPTPTHTPTPAPTPTPLPPGPKEFVMFGCGGCHAIDGLSIGATGPDLTQIGGRADADYIRQSILDPDAVIAEACPRGDCFPGIMPQNFSERISAEEIDALVAFLVAQQ